jgi:nucleotide-binding universal stress UspA family protein
MSYKSIFVCLNDGRRAPQLLGLAAGLAARHDAHLLGLCVLPPVIAVRNAVPGRLETLMVEAHRDEHRQEIELISAAFDEAASGERFSAEWRLDDAERGTVADKVIEHARAADLIIASQTDPAWEKSEQFEAPERLIIESGRPVLMVPNTWPSGGFGRRAVVAWNGRREAARAAFDALPLLQAAESIHIIRVSAQDDGEAAGEGRPIDLCATLARHGVACEATEIIDPQMGIGRTLFAQVANDRADLLVMGCYGHSRLREFVFGGASRHVLQHMSVPVLMSH